MMPKPGSRTLTVEAWLTEWVESVAAPSVRENTLAGYRTAIYKHLIPGLGAHKLRKLEPGHLEKLSTKIVAGGAKPGTAHQVHRTAKTAFAVACEREYIFKNPAKLAKAPRVEEEEVIAFAAAEGRRILAAAEKRRNGARFVVALALGLRRGEEFGLKWSRMDLDAGLLRTPRQIQRHNTAATMLRVLKVPLPAIMDVMGWGDAAVAKRYVHVPTEVVSDNAGRGIAARPGRHP